jgi:membrane protein involved in colicin uptake
MASDPKQRFKQYVGKEGGGGRPKGQGFITELQRQKLQPAHLDSIVERNKKKNHFPKRIPDAEWKDVKAELKRKQYDTKQVAGNNKKAAPAKKKAAPAKKKAAPAKKKANAAAVPSVAPRRSTRSTKGKKGK